ncbi:hypothetical protein [Sphingomonas sp. CARO-RG-8B-R24-01]|uniref:hypothetical protein n=1 Tax=Sphingomonas sp. CARO-RG-8B-R24-01 TaxID=2914831 RepID=UPI001F56E0E9|nr:hypothetical protein [Sphingomonas sp. CARO-RG-8B-R24-01]
MGDHFRLRAMRAFGIDRHALDERRQNLCGFAPDRLSVEHFAQAADLLVEQLQKLWMRQDHGRGCDRRRCAQLSFQARFLGLAVRKEFQQGRAGQGYQHVGGERVDLAGYDGQALDDRLVLSH